MSRRIAGSIVVGLALTLALPAPLDARELDALDELLPLGPGGVTAASETEADLADDLFRRLSDEREARGERPLEWDPRLAELAYDWSRTMAESGEYRHRDLSKAKEDFPEYSGLGENIYQLLPSYESTGYAHRGWMQSTGHRNNIINPGYDRVGIGVVCAEDGRMWATQNFGRLRDSDAPPFDYDDSPSSPLTHDTTEGPSCKDLPEDSGEATGATQDVDEPVTPEPPEWVTYQRAAGRERVETAVVASRLHFDERAEAAVLARADSFADALAGAVLAGAVEGPVLLTSRTRLPDAVREEIARLDVDMVYALGGQAALTDDVLAAVPEPVRRLAGPDRFATAAVVADEVSRLTSAPSDHVFVANGVDGWPDAVSVSSLAARRGEPLLLATADRLPPATRQALGGGEITTVTFVGGEAVMGQAAREAAELGVEVERIAGPTRYETAAAVRDVAEASGMRAATTLITTLRNWPDSLVVGAAAARHDALVLSVAGASADSEPSDAYAYARERSEDLEYVDVIGGPAAVSEEVMARFFDELRDAFHEDEQDDCLLFC